MYFKSWQGCIFSYNLWYFARLVEHTWSLLIFLLFWGEATKALKCSVLIWKSFQNVFKSKLNIIIKTRKNICEIFRKILRSSIWTPDIVLINAAGNGDEGMEKRTLVKVSFKNSFHKIFSNKSDFFFVFFLKIISDWSHWPRDSAYPGNLREQMLGNRNL